MSEEQLEECLRIASAALERIAEYVPDPLGDIAAHAIAAMNAIDEGYRDSGEGPFDDVQTATDFAEAEVGVEWDIIQQGNKWHVFVREE